jgi:DNA repair exonuclease SbcCD ATPase subunit
MIDQTDHIEELLSKIDQLSVELDQTKKELAQAISERTPHDYGLLQEQRDHYRERLGVAAKEVFELKAELLTKERHIEDLQKAAVTNLTATVALVRPEPSRLEIAAQLVAGRFANTTFVTKISGDWIKYALDGADALIAAAKEVAK